jgi:hypothetical protein
MALTSSVKKVADVTTAGKWRWVYAARVRQCGKLAEYGVDTYPSESQAARGGLLPTTEILSLEDYRTRYATYRTDLARICGGRR